MSPLLVFKLVSGAGERGTVKMGFVFVTLSYYLNEVLKIMVEKIQV